MIKRPQNYKDLLQECGLRVIEPNQDFTFQVLLDIGLDNHKEKVEEISKRADKQYNIEKKLDETVAKFKDISIE